MISSSPILGLILHLFQQHFHPRESVLDFQGLRHQYLLLHLHQLTQHGDAEVLGKFGDLKITVWGVVAINLQKSPEVHIRGRGKRPFVHTKVRR